MTTQAPSPSKRTRSPSNPYTRLEIAQWWLDYRLEVLKDLFHGDYPPTAQELSVTCWACHKETKTLQRCHLTPRSRGGGIECDNMTLLCGECHHEAPSVCDDGTAMLAWIRDRENMAAVAFADAIQAISECRVEDLRAFMGREDAEVVIKKVAAEVFGKIEIHGGSLSRASRRWVLREIIALCGEIGASCVSA